MTYSMTIKISAEAKEVLMELSKFVEAKNTPGAGKRFRNKFVLKIKEQLKHSEHLNCKHPKLNEQKLKCFFINDWVIAYQKNDDSILIYLIIHGSLLAY